MSASERLRALDENYSWRNEKVLRKALSLIADVVEAAEEVEDTEFGELNYLIVHLRRALTALQEHLEGPTGPVGQDTC